MQKNDTSTCLAKDLSSESQNLSDTQSGLLVVLLAKMISVWYFSSRNVSKGFPFDSFLFNVNDRFTDYLIPYVVSGYPNIYFPPLGATLPAPPYGHVQFALLKYLPFRDSHWIVYGNFLLVIALFVIALYVIFRFAYPQQASEGRLRFLILLVVAYPLHFIIDRGNLDIYGALAIAYLFGLVIRRAQFSDPQVALILAFLISLKPSLGLFAVPLLLGVKFRWAMPAILLVLFNYLVPFIFYGQPINAMWEAITVSQTFTDGAVLFCHSFQCAHNAMGIKWGTSVSVLFLAVFLVAVMYLRFVMRKHARSEIFLMLMTSTVLLTLIFNLQSWDYRLTFLIPIMLARPKIFPARYMSRIQSVVLSCSFVVALGYVNILFPNSRAYPTIARCAALLLIFGLFVYVLKRKIDTPQAAELSDENQQGEISL